MNQNALFTDDQVDIDLLRRRSFMRWSTFPPDVIPLTAADPDFIVAKEIREAVEAFGRDGVMGYCGPEGLPSLRESIVRVMAERRRIRCSPEQIILTGGAAPAMWLVARYACRPGDEAILFDPVDLLFGMSIDAVGAKRVYSPVDKKTGAFDLDGLKELITPKTRMICLCNPHNPLGRVMTEKELIVIGELAVKHNLVIMADEVWADIIFRPHKHVSIASLSPEIAGRTFSIQGLSKTFAMAGLRMGYVVAPDPRTSRELLQASIALGIPFGVTTVSQIAAQAAYDKCWYWADSFMEHLHDMRDLAVDRLNRMPGVSCVRPEGAYIVFPDISQLGLTSQQATDYLIKEAGVAVVPGTPEWFGPGGEGNIRICFSTSRAILSQGMDRIQEAFSRLHRS